MKRLVGGGHCPKCGEPVRIIDSTVQPYHKVTEEQTEEIKQAEQEGRLFCPCGGSLRYTAMWPVPADSKRAVGPEETQAREER